MGSCHASILGTRVSVHELRSSQGDRLWAAQFTEREVNLFKCHGSLVNDKPRCLPLLMSRCVCWGQSSAAKVVQKSLHISLPSSDPGEHHEGGRKLWRGQEIQEGGRYWKTRLGVSEERGWERGQQMDEYPCGSSPVCSVLCHGDPFVSFLSPL